MSPFLSALHFRQFWVVHNQVKRQSLPLELFMKERRSTVKYKEATEILRDNLLKIPSPDAHPTAASRGRPYTILTLLKPQN